MTFDVETIRACRICGANPINGEEHTDRNDCVAELKMRLEYAGAEQRHLMSRLELIVALINKRRAGHYSDYSDYYDGYQDAWDEMGEALKRS